MYNNKPPILNFKAFLCVIIPFEVLKIIIDCSKLFFNNCKAFNVIKKLFAGVEINLQDLKKGVCL